MHRPTKTAVVAVAVGAAVAAAATACTYDTHELPFDRLTCRTADKSLHTVQLVVSRGNTASTYAVVTVSGVRGDASVKKTTTYVALSTAEAHGQHWHGPYVVTGRNGNFNVKAIGGMMVNTWVETTRGSCLATGTVYWEGQITG